MLLYAISALIPSIIPVIVHENGNTEKSPVTLFIGSRGKIKNIHIILKRQAPKSEIIIADMEYPIPRTAPLSVCHMPFKKLVVRVMVRI